MATGIHPTKRDAQEGESCASNVAKGATLPRNARKPVYNIECKEQLEEISVVSQGASHERQSAVFAKTLVKLQLVHFQIDYANVNNYTYNVHVLQLKHTEGENSLCVYRRS